LKNSILLDWLTTKNIVTVIGKYLFLHGGFSPDFLAADLSIDFINDYGRKNEYDEQKHDLFYNALGPLWYRGLVMDTTVPYLKASEDHVNKILERYNVSQIIIGHTPVSDISYDYNHKVIRIGVIHGNDKFSGKTSGLLIENNIINKINDLGEKFNIDIVDNSRQ